MGEQSHVEAMRAAIRGDFERLERRRGAQELMRVAAPLPNRDERSVEEPCPPALPKPRSWLERLLAR